MIVYLSGKVARKDADRVVVDVNGVGYEVLISLTSLGKLPAVGQETGVHTYLHVREDAMQLFGFADEAEREVFLRLIGVSGFGPKLALSILSVFPPDEFANVLHRSDVKALTTIPGVGEKGAKRLVLELQEKLIPTGEAGLPADLNPDAKSVFAEAREALVVLGYSPAEASRALEGYPSPDGDKTALEDVIKYALKNLSSV